MTWINELHIDDVDDLTPGSLQSTSSRTRGTAPPRLGINGELKQEYSVESRLLTPAPATKTTMTLHILKTLIRHVALTARLPLELAIRPV
jgi:hypothetical protein